MAKDVKVTFSLPIELSKEQTVAGYLYSLNAVPSRCWDSVTLRNDQYFYIEYIKGSALLENNGIGSVSKSIQASAPGIPLSDNPIHNGAKIGYNALDGLIPGYSKYAGYVTIKIHVHMKQ